MIGFWFFIILIASLLIANKQIKIQERRRQEALEWIMNVDERCCSGDWGAALRHHSNDIDEVIIDMHESGSDEAYEQEATEEGEMEACLL